MTTPAVHSTLGIVLAGGKSTRMQVDKSDLIVANMTNLDRAIALLQQCAVNEVVVSGNGAGHISDRYNNGGPLAGILSVIEQKNPTEVVVVPVDMPLLTPSSINQLMAQGLTNNTPCCYQGSSLPIFLPVSPALKHWLSEQFSCERYRQQGKGPSFKHLLKHFGATLLTPLNTNTLVNANTPSQWQTLLTLVEQQAQKRRDK